MSAMHTHSHPNEIAILSPTCFIFQRNVVKNVYLFIISETIGASNFNIYQRVSFSSLCITTGNDDTSNSQASANGVSMAIYRSFSITTHPTLERLRVLKRALQVLYFVFCKLLDILLLGLEKKWCPILDRCCRVTFSGIAFRTTPPIGGLWCIHDRLRLGKIFRLQPRDKPNKNRIMVIVLSRE